MVVKFEKSLLKKTTLKHKTNIRHCDENITTPTIVKIQLLACIQEIYSPKTRKHLKKTRNRDKKNELKKINKRKVER